MMQVCAFFNRLAASLIILTTSCCVKYLLSRRIAPTCKEKVWGMSLELHLSNVLLKYAQNLDCMLRHTSCGKIPIDVSAQ